MIDTKEETFALSVEVDKDTLFFDNTVGALQDILLDSKFEKLQNAYLDKHCQVFDAESKENKLEYMPIFKNWVSLIEKFITEELTTRVKGYSSEKFSEMMKKKSDEITGDVFDMLMSLSDFEEFRSLILSYKAEKAGKGIKLCTPTK
eukprot:CAMPEP_0184491482 /NCGR_PEP_ID=MMETSP0113_2-20130426/20521_1 /TAXON_ID=91329 /ORGANISM="Norrisiella sphaerica, Strain BC52" /LENGTH=146 /DNA_ID=CAMNT_0026875865 /DNA_START=180 /DNA_END=620 /DNA_ORIENTATION=-